MGYAPFFTDWADAINKGCAVRLNGKRIGLKVLNSWIQLELHLPVESKI